MSPHSICVRACTHTYFQGEWDNQRMHGTGERTYANGDVYSGEMRHHKMHGRGTATYIRGDGMRVFIHFKPPSLVCTIARCNACILSTHVSMRAHMWPAYYMYIYVFIFL